MTAVQRFQHMIVNVSGAELGWRYGRFTLKDGAKSLSAIKLPKDCFC